MGCMPSALSEPDGAGLGTLGFHEAVARRMTPEAGFSRFTRHDFENPLNAYYEGRILMGHAEQGESYGYEPECYQYGESAGKR